MRLLLLFPALTLAACGASGDAPASEAQDDESRAVQSDPVTATITEQSPEEPNRVTSQLDSEDQGRVCRAAIADINGQSPEIIKVKSNSQGQIVVRYNRPSDGKAWTNECKFEGDRVIWRTIGAFGGSEPGRWRDSGYDETITFQIDGSDITIFTVYSDGSGGNETYTVN